MGNVYLVYLLPGQIHSVFSVFGGWRVEYTASVYFVYLFQGQIHRVFGVFASVHNPESTLYGRWTPAEGHLPGRTDALSERIKSV